MVDGIPAFTLHSLTGHADSAEFHPKIYRAGRNNSKKTRTPPWRGSCQRCEIKSGGVLLAAASYETQQAEPGEQHCIGLGFRYRECGNCSTIDKQIYSVSASTADVAVGAEAAESVVAGVIVKPKTDRIGLTHGRCDGLGNPVVRLHRTVRIIICSRMRVVGSDDSSESRTERIQKSPVRRGVCTYRTRLETPV